MHLWLPCWEVCTLHPGLDLLVRSAINSCVTATLKDERCPELEDQRMRQVTVTRKHVKCFVVPPPTHANAYQLLKLAVPAAGTL